MGASRAVRPLAFFLLTFSLFLLVWPATGRSQSQSRRERYRRDTSGGQDSTRSRSTRPERAKRPSVSKSEATAPGTAQPSARITGPAEPNAAAKPVARPSQPVAGPSRPVARPAIKPPAQDEQWAKYEIILQRNMFSRLRVPYRPQEPVVEAPRVMPDPESYLLLRGLVQEDNQFIAFVEDKQSGNVLRLHVGDHVARGTIKSLDLDSLQYEFGDKTTTVHIGYDLEGGQGAVTAGDLANYTPVRSSTTQAPSTSQSSTPPANEDEILKRLMEQRKQQLGQ